MTNTELLTRLMFDKELQHIVGNMGIVHGVGALMNDSNADNAAVADIIVKELYSNMDVDRSADTKTPWRANAAELIDLNSFGSIEFNEDGTINQEFAKKSNKALSKEEIADGENPEVQPDALGELWADADVEGLSFDDKSMTDKIQEYSSPEDFVTAMASNLGLKTDSLRDILVIAISQVRHDAFNVSPAFTSQTEIPAIPDNFNVARSSRVNMFNRKTTNDRPRVDLRDIARGFTEDAIKMHRIASGRLGVYSNAVGDVPFGVITESFESRYRFANGEGASYVDSFTGSDEEITVSGKDAHPRHGTISKEDKAKAKLLVDEKRAKEQGKLSDFEAVKDAKLKALDTISDRGNEALDELRNDYSNADTNEEKKAAQDVYDIKIAELLADKVMLEKELEDLDAREHYELMQKKFELTIFEERVRQEIRRFRYDAAHSPSSYKIRRNEFDGRGGFNKYLQDSMNEGKSFIDTFDDYFTGRVSENDIKKSEASSSRDPMVDVEKRIQAMMREGATKKAFGDPTDYRDDGGYSFIQTGRNNKRSSEHPVLSSPNGATTSDAPLGLAQELGYDVQHAELSEKRFEAAKEALYKNNKRYAELADANSTLIGSIDKVVKTFTDFSVSDDLHPREQNDVDFLFAALRDGNLELFMRDVKPFIGRSFGGFLMNAINMSRLTNSKLVLTDLMHQDAQIKHYLAHDKPSQEIMLTMMGRLDAGLHHGNGRYGADISNKKFNDELKEKVKVCGHQKANAAYTADLITVVTEDMQLVSDDGSIVELSPLEQIQKNINVIKGSLGYQNIKKLRETHRLKRSSRSVEALLNQAEAFLDEYNGSEEGLSKALNSHLKEGMDKAAIDAVDMVKERLNNAYKESALVSEMIGESSTSYHHLSDKVEGFVPHLIVGSSKEAVSGNKNESKAHKMAMGVRRVISPKITGHPLNLSLTAVANAEFAKTNALNKTSLEYGFIDSVFGYESEGQTSGLNDGTQLLSDDINLISGAKALSGFGAQVVTKQFENDTRAGYVRGYGLAALSFNKTIGYAKSLYGATQVSIQFVTGFTGMTGKDGFKASAYMVEHMYKYFADPEYKAALIDIMKTHAPHLYHRQFNGMESLENASKDLYWSDVKQGTGAETSDRLSYAAHTLGTGILLVPKTGLTLTVGLADAAILWSSYAAQIKLHTGKNIKEVALNKDLFAKDLTLARIDTESVMAQSDTSKKGDLFQQEKSDFKEMLRLSIIPWSNQKVTMASDALAYRRMLAVGGAAEKRNAVAGLISIATQQVAYKAVGLVGWRFMAGLLLGLDDEEKEDNRIPDGEDFLKYLVFGSVMELLTVANPFLALDSVGGVMNATATFGLNDFMTKYGAGVPAHGEDGKVGSARVWSPQSKQYISAHPKGSWGAFGDAVGEEMLGGTVGVHDTSYNLFNLLADQAYAKQNYKFDWRHRVNYMSAVGFAPREFGSVLRTGIKKDLGVDHGRGDVFHKYDSWENSTDVPEPIWQKSDMKPLPDSLYELSNQMYSDVHGYKRYKVDFKYNMRIDGDSFDLKTWFDGYKSFRLYGIDTFEKKYSQKDYGKKELLKQHANSGLGKEEMLHLGKEATWHVAELLKGKQIEFYTEKDTGMVNINGKKMHSDNAHNGRQYAFARIKTSDGKWMDLGIYLIAKGLAFYREGNGLPNKSLPNGMAPVTYRRHLDAAKAHAKANSLGMYFDGDPLKRFSYDMDNLKARYGR